jgi:hypothetical protein
MKYSELFTPREAIMALCFLIIGACLVIPALGWKATLGLWILLSVNNFETTKKLTHFVNLELAKAQFRSLLLGNAADALRGRIQEAFASGGDDLWDARNISPDVEHCKECGTLHGEPCTCNDDIAKREQETEE